jgi:MFS-type transporter involved in bile tolerance (Atg22 family)
VCQKYLLLSPPFQAGANLFGPILAGYLWQETGNLDSAFYYMGSVMGVGAVGSLILPAAIRKSEEKKMRELEKTKA